MRCGLYRHNVDKCKVNKIPPYRTLFAVEKRFKNRLRRNKNARPGLGPAPPGGASPSPEHVLDRVFYRFKAVIDTFSTCGKLVVSGADMKTLLRACLNFSFGFINERQAHSNSVPETFDTVRQGHSATVLFPHLPIAGM